MFRTFTLGIMSTIAVSAMFLPMYALAYALTQQQR